MIKLSIIVPFKKTSETLFELLNTIPDNPDYEIILVDDSGEENFGNDNHQKKNLRIYKNNSGVRGAGAARNIGISKARGKWLIFADSDDWFTEDAFLIFENYVNSEAYLIYFQPASKHHKSNTVATRHRHYAELVYEFIHYGSEWIRYRFHPPWSKMVKRSLFVEHGIWFDETIVANDITCSLRLGLYAKRIDASDQTVYIVRQGRPDSLSSKRGEHYFDIRMENHFQYNSILYEFGLSNRSMGGLSTLRKALRLGYRKFLGVFCVFIKRKQPILEKPSYYWILIKRKTRSGKFLSP